MLRSVILLAAAMFSVGCMSPRLYPVCFYNEAPSERVANEYYLPHLASALQTSLGSKRKVDVSDTPDGRWLVAQTTESENLAAAAVWPRIGCIGRAEDSPGVRREADCVSFISAFVKDQNYFAFGNAKDAGGIDIWSEASDNKAVVRCRAVKVTDRDGKPAVAPADAPVDGKP